MIKVMLLAAVLGNTIRICEVDGVVTYTDRDDVCVEGEELELGAGPGTFSMVDAFDIPPPPPQPERPPEPRTVIVERYFYPSEPAEHVHHRVVAQPAFFPVQAGHAFGRHHRKKDRPRGKTQPPSPPSPHVFPRPVHRPGQLSPPTMPGPPSVRPQPPEPQVARRGSIHGNQTARSLLPTSPVGRRWAVDGRR